MNSSRSLNITNYFAIPYFNVFTHLESVESSKQHFLCKLSTILPSKVNFLFQIPEYIWIHLFQIVYLQSVIQLINQTSQGFREGKKWKCNSRCGTRDRNSTNRTFRDRLASTRQTSQCRCKRLCSQCDITEEESSMLTHSKTLDYDSMHRKRTRPLVRQMATTSENSDSRRLRVAGNLPGRQWTTDASFSETEPENTTMKSKATSSPMVMSATSNAFLLRPVSRNSQAAANKTTPETNLQSPAVKAAIAAAVAAAKGPKGTSPSDHISMNSFGPEVHSAPNGTIQSRLLRKQRTTESAPNNHIMVGGHIIRQVPRQHSAASAYSMAIPSTYSHQGITLVRGASCSLVDIPTYLGPMTSGGMVEVAGKAGGVSSAGALTQYPRHANSRPRLQLDLTKKNNTKNAKSTRKTKWTILCVGLTLLTMCVTLVGTMLSIGPQYQDMMVARKWENEMSGATSRRNNFSSTEGSTMETTSVSPLLSILKIAKEPEIGHAANEEVQTTGTKVVKGGGKSFSRGRVNSAVRGSWWDGNDPGAQKLVLQN